MSPRPAKSISGKPRLLRGKSLGVVGLGQIGGSIVRRLNDYRPDITLFGADRNTRIAGRVRRYCRWSASLDDMVRAVDVLVLAVPVADIIELLPQIATAIERIGARAPLVCDTGTVKQAIIRAAARHANRFQFVGLHPFCGSELSGWDSARNTLFVDQPIVCCAPTGNKGVPVAAELIRLLGGRMVRMDAARHDREIALTIGLPHALAYAANALAVQTRPAAELIGGSWQSLTRVAASDTEMVAGFLGANAPEQRRTLSEFKRALERLERLMANGSDHHLAGALKKWHSPHR